MGMKQPYTLTNDDVKYLHARIGTAFIATQRVEFLTSQLLELLAEFPDLYPVSTAEFLSAASKSKKGTKTLGTIFKLLKFNPNLVVEKELDDYLKKRNHFVHEFWKTYMIGPATGERGNVALAFIYELEESSNRMERYFKGFIFGLSLRHVATAEDLDPEIKKWEDDFEFFMSSVQQQKTRS